MVAQCVPDPSKKGSILLMMNSKSTDQCLADFVNILKKNHLKDFDKITFFAEYIETDNNREHIVQIMIAEFTKQEMNMYQLTDILTNNQLDSEANHNYVYKIDISKGDEIVYFFVIASFDSDIDYL
jgi:hypothetical protein